MYIVRSMGSKFYVKCQRASSKFHTKFWTHTPQNMHFALLYFCVWGTTSLNCDVISFSETGPVLSNNIIYIVSISKIVIKLSQIIINPPIFVWGTQQYRRISPRNILAASGLPLLTHQYGQLAFPTDLLPFPWSLALTTSEAACQTKLHPIPTHQYCRPVFPRDILPFPRWEVQTAQETFCHPVGWHSTNSRCHLRQPGKRRQTATMHVYA